MFFHKYELGEGEEMGAVRHSVAIARTTAAQ